MAGRFVKITQEAAFGTYNAGGTVLTPRFSGSNAFSYMTNPEFWSVMDGSGLNIAALAGTATARLTGTLTTELCYSQALFLLGWALQRINAGQTSPWTTTELPNDLASCTCDFGYQPFDSATFKTIRFLGCKCGSISLAASKEAPKVMATVGLLGGSPSANPTLTAPLLTDYATDVCLFQHLKSGFTMLGASRTNFDSFTFTCTNQVKPYWDENQYAVALRLGSRNISVQANLRLKSGSTDRAAYEAGTVGTLKLVFTNGTHTITLDMRATAYITQFQESYPLTEESYVPVTIVPLLDVAAGTEFTLTYA
jgi:hypothetical protein